MRNVRTLFAVALAASLYVVPAHAQGPPEFGYRVLLDGDDILISEPVDPDGTGAEGNHRTVYVYSRSGSGWTRSGTIQAPPHEGADYFGRSMVLDGERYRVVGVVADGAVQQADL